MLFSENTKPKHNKNRGIWKILVVDDDTSIHELQK